MKFEYCDAHIKFKFILIIIFLTSKGGCLHHYGLASLILDFLRKISTIYWKIPISYQCNIFIIYVLVLLESIVYYRGSTIALIVLSTIIMKSHILGSHAWDYGCIKYTGKIEKISTFTQHNSHTKQVIYFKCNCAF